eukprot:scaffold24925_cov66-Phaeocystis_antarctica.AAC.6
MKWNAPPPVALGVRRKAQLPASTWRLGGWFRVLGAAEEPNRSDSRGHPGCAFSVAPPRLNPFQRASGRMPCLARRCSTHGRCG